MKTGDSKVKMSMAEAEAVSQGWDRYWKSGEAAYAPHREIIERIERHVGSRDAIIVEVGAGSGVDSVEIALKGYNVVALDMSRESLKLVKSNIKGVGLPLSLVVADAMALPFKDGSIDFVFHQGVMEHFKDPADFLAEQRRSLREHGALLVDVPQTFTWYTIEKKWDIFRNKWFAGWETQYSPRGLRRLLKKTGFNVLEIYGRGYDLRLLDYMSRIEVLGEKRFGKRIAPGFISRPVGWIWRRWEALPVSNYLKQCVGAIAVKENERTD